MLALGKGELGGQMPLLGALGGLERCFSVWEVGAGILPVGIEKEIVDRAVDVVVVRDVAARAAGRIELCEPAREEARDVQALCPARQRVRHGILEHQGQQVIDAPLLHDEPAIHVGLADGQMRVEGELALELAVHEPRSHLRALAIAKAECLPIVGNEGEIAVLHDATEQDFERLEHGTPRRYAPAYGSLPGPADLGIGLLYRPRIARS